MFGCDILLWNCFEEFGKMTSKGTPVSHLPPNIVQKAYNFMLSYNLSHVEKAKTGITFDLEVILFFLKKHFLNMFQLKKIKLHAFSAVQ